MYAPDRAGDSQADGRVQQEAGEREVSMSRDELLDLQTDASDEAADDELWEVHQDHEEFIEECVFCVMETEDAA
jgi:hypothetical protein